MSDDPRRSGEAEFAARPAEMLYHDLRAALGAAGLTLETLQLMPATESWGGSAPARAMLDRALAAIYRAGDLASELEDLERSLRSAKQV